MVQDIGIQVQLMDAGEKIFYLLIPVSFIYLFRERRAHRRARAAAPVAPPPADPAAEPPVKTPQWTPRSALVFVVVFVVVGGLIVLQAVVEKKAGTPGNTGQSLGSLGSDLCKARDAVATDPAQAVAIFRDRVHGPLHELADKATKADRKVAARLLEAKYAVESATGQFPPPDNLGAALGQLNQQAAAALVSIKAEVPNCLYLSAGGAAN